MLELNRKISMKNSGYIIFTFKFRKEGNRWTAHCEELGTATFGRSIPEAHRKLKEAVLLHLNTLEDIGERDHFFKKHNIRFHSHRPRKSEIKISGPVDPDTFVKPYIYPLQKEIRNI